MHILLQRQLKKVCGKGFDIDNISPDELGKILELVSESYSDFEDENRLIEHTLEVNSRELTQANRSITKSHDLLRSVTESISDLIFYKDLEFRYIGCNKNFAELVSKPVSEIIGRVDNELFNKESSEHFRKMDERCLLQNEAVTNKEWVTYANGEKRYLITLKSPLKDNSGKVFGLVGISRDITKEYQLEEEMKTQQFLMLQQGRLAAMGEMIGNIAHQWRQPLNTLGLIIQNMEDAFEFGELDGAYLDTTTTQAMVQINHMSKTIDDFREFFNPNKEKKVFLVKDALLEAYEIVQASFSGDGIEFTFEGSSELKLNGFKNELSQVIFNLLNNARDVLVDNKIAAPKVNLRLLKSEHTLNIIVSDNGGGIDESIMERVFEPYFTTKEEGKGTGIGLYMSKIIIEDHMSGKIEVINENGGVSFKILLPFEDI